MQLQRCQVPVNNKKQQEVMEDERFNGSVMDWLYSAWFVYRHSHMYEATHTHTHFLPPDHHTSPALFGAPCLNWLTYVSCSFYTDTDSDFSRWILTGLEIVGRVRRDGGPAQILKTSTN